jgi:ubiquinone/menaquinone biosynthesis C-methylase UbiE
MSVQEKEQALADIYGLLKPGGRLLFTHLEMNKAYIRKEEPCEAGIYRVSNSIENRVMSELSRYEKCEDNDFWRKASPQMYFIRCQKTGRFSLILLPMLRQLSAKYSLCEINAYYVTEVVSAKTLTDKVVAAGFDAKNTIITRFNFDEPPFNIGVKNTAASFLVIVIKQKP